MKWLTNHPNPLVRKHKELLQYSSFLKKKRLQVEAYLIDTYKATHQDVKVYNQVSETGYVFKPFMCYQESYLEGYSYVYILNDKDGKDVTKFLANFSEDTHITVYVTTNDIEQNKQHYAWCKHICVNMSVVLYEFDTNNTLKVK